MAEPNQQIEVQLGHLCNNRCVFCVSGQLSEQDRAPQLPEAPIRRQIEAARAGGATKITFLGGEPTIQRSFPALLQLAVDLDFEEIVIFTNGVMTPRESFRQGVLRIVDGLGPDARQRLIWRFSLQGGDREAHDATTVNPGAWDRIQESMEVLHGSGARMSGNMCVVAGNHASVPKLAEVAKRYELENLHLDMFRPRDSGDRTEAYLRDLMSVPYKEMAASFRALVHEVDEKLGPDFDLNIGNMPYCVAPDIAWRIHHDGEDTVTVAASGSGTTQEGFNKYKDKRSDKHKLPTCGDCAFSHKCGGVFDLYAEVHGHGELSPVAPDALWDIYRGGHHFVLLAEDAVRRWAAADARRRLGRIDERSAEIDVSAHVGGQQFWKLVLLRTGRTATRQGWATFAGKRMTASLVGQAPAPLGDHVQALRDALAALFEQMGDACPTVSAQDLSHAWQAENRRLRGERQRLLAVRGKATKMIERLRGKTLGGLRQSALHKEGDGSQVSVRFGSEDKHLTLAIGLRPVAPATRPSLQHTAQGLSAEELAAANRDLAAVLRSDSRSRSAANV